MKPISRTLFLLFPILIFRSSLASYCGKSGVPYSFEVLPSGAPVLGCAQPSCVIAPPPPSNDDETAGQIEDSEFLTDVNGQSDGFFRDGDRAQKRYRHESAPKLVANCSGGFNELSCPRKNQWVGGIEYIDHPRQPLILQCCSFDGLRFSQEVGSTTVGPGEAITGGEVIRNGRQISFDVIANVKKIVRSSSSQKVSYEVTVRRMNCLPDPPEPEVQFDQDVPEEVSKVLSSAFNKDLGTADKFEKKTAPLKQQQKKIKQKQQAAPTEQLPEISDSTNNEQPAAQTQQLQTPHPLPQPHQRQLPNPGAPVGAGSGQNFEARIAPIAPQQQQQLQQIASPYNGQPQGQFQPGQQQPLPQQFGGQQQFPAQYGGQQVQQGQSQYGSQQLGPNNQQQFNGQYGQPQQGGQFVQEPSQYGATAQNQFPQQQQFGQQAQGAQQIQPGQIQPDQQGQSQAGTSGLSGSASVTPAPYDPFSFPTLPPHTFPTFPTLPPHTFPTTLFPLHSFPTHTFPTLPPHTFPTHTFPGFPTFAPLGVTPAPLHGFGAATADSSIGSVPPSPSGSGAGNPVVHAAPSVSGGAALPISSLTPLSSSPSGGGLSALPSSDGASGAGGSISQPTQQQSQGDQHLPQPSPPLQLQSQSQQEPAQSQPQQPLSASQQPPLLQQQSAAQQPFGSQPQPNRALGAPQGPPRPPPAMGTVLQALEGYHPISVPGLGIIGYSNSPQKRK
ncbi:warthog protein 1 [Ditylenchus destructor]|uniref:Warthog protein 1 n=1 Tax=Ditylenchus destructor TaxID=166010 RepID=A0AAD4MUN3_9BILA|nr:warthog protein 1 [Ditylenchus destructor]